MQTADSGLIKRINAAIVLQALRKTSPTSRAAIAKLTGLTKATVSSLVTDLIAEQYAVEVGASYARARGRRPQLLVFNAQAGMMVGAELDGHQMHRLVCDLEGRVVWRDSEPLCAEKSFDQVFGAMVAGLKKALANAPPSPRGVLGVGLTVPCLVDDQSGIVLEGVNVGWKDVPLASLLSQHVGVPVVVENSARMSALGELRFGAGRGVQDMLYLHSVLGLGGGIVMGGTLWRGAKGYAGELGHMIVEPNGLHCTCGNRGCWELYASELALRRQLLGRGRWAQARDLTVSEVVDAAHEGDGLAISALEEVGHYLGLGVVSLVNALNPSLVIVGGSVSQAGTWILRPVERVLRQRALGPLAASVRVIGSMLGQDAAALGTASLVLDNLFSPPRVTTELVN